MIRIPNKIVEQIILHAKKDLPNEACGYLAGLADTVTKAYAIKNIDQSHEHFSFDPQEQFAVIKDMHSRKTPVMNPSLAVISNLSLEAICRDQ